jgi:hypothetical protein
VRKAILYGVGTLLLVLALMIAPKSETETSTHNMQKQTPIANPEKYVKLQLADVKWPSEKKKRTKKPKSAKKTKARSKASPKSKGVNANGNQNGGYNIVGDFNCTVSEYLQYMRQKGALVVVYEKRKKRFWELTRAGMAVPVDKLHGRYSPQTRRLTDDYPEKERIVALINSRYGPGNYEILLLMPEALDQHIKTSLEKIVRQHTRLSKLTAVHLTYRKSGSGFIATVDWGLADGKKIPIGQNIRI